MNWFHVSLAASILLGVVGQLFLKAGAEGEGVRGTYLAPQSVAGLGFYLAAALCYMFALRTIPVSVAFPAVSLSYPLVVALAFLLYDEPLGWHKLAGVALICGGVFLVARQA